MGITITLEEFKELIVDPNFCAVCNCNRTDVAVVGNVCESCMVDIDTADETLMEYATY